jgi:hypothetical protein
VVSGARALEPSPTTETTGTVESQQGARNRPTDDADVDHSLSTLDSVRPAERHWRGWAVEEMTETEGTEARETEGTEETEEGINAEERRFGRRGEEVVRVDRKSIGFSNASGRP